MGVHEVSEPGAGNIRPAAECDLESIRRIYAWHVLHGLASFEEVPPTVDEMRSRWAALVTERRPCLVAESGGAVLGFAYAGPYRSRPAYQYTVENSIYVDRNALRQGLGAKLLDALIAECERGPWRQMVAVIGDSANEASIALHRRAGFRDVGVLRAVGFKHGRWVDSVILQRALGPGDGAPPDAKGP